MVSQLIHNGSAPITAEQPLTLDNNWKALLWSSLGVIAYVESSPVNPRLLVRIDDPKFAMLEGPPDAVKLTLEEGK